MLIRLTQPNGDPIYANPAAIATVERHHPTYEPESLAKAYVEIGGHFGYLVRESPDEVANLVSDAEGGQSVGATLAGIERMLAIIADNPRRY